MDLDKAYSMCKAEEVKMAASAVIYFTIQGARDPCGKDVDHTAKA